MGFYTLILLLLAGNSFLDAKDVNSSGLFNAQTKLIRDLIRDSHYDPNALPRRNDSHIVEVELAFNLLSIEELNEKSQLLTTTAWLGMSWIDEFLTWDPSEYNGVPYVVLRATDIWLPDIVIRNSANSVYGDILDHAKFRTIVNSTGWVNYWTAGKIHSTCQVDISYFPFDDQACYIKVDSWTYTGDMMRLKNVTQAINLDDTERNGQWEIFKNETRYEMSPFNGVSYPVMTFVFFIRRKPLFMVMTIVLPSVILALLVILVFYLPADAGEKLSLGITLLLSFSVFQLLLADSLPRSSDYTPILSIFIMCTMGLSALSLLMSLVVLNIHHKDPDQRLSIKSRTILFGRIAKVICMRHIHMKFCPHTTGAVFPDTNQNSVGQTRTSSAKPSNEDVKDKSNGFQHGRNPDNGPNDSSERWTEVMADVKAAERKEEWVAAAKVVDRIFLLIFLFTTITISVVILGIIPALKKEIAGPIGLNNN